MLNADARRSSGRSDDACSVVAREHHRGPEHADGVVDDAFDRAARPRFGVVDDTEPIART
jgi:hypothetical protein